MIVLTFCNVLPNPGSFGFCHPAPGITGKSYEILQSEFITSSHCFNFD